MTLSEVREYLDEAKKVGAKSVWFFGGEPLFYFDLLLGGVEYAKQIGLTATTTSNAFWAVSEELALKRLRLLKGKGLAWISFSADPFHWEYVPLEYLRNAAKAAEELGLGGEMWNCYFVEKDGDEVLRLSREITTRLSAHEVSVGHVMFQGTAVEILAERAPKQPWTRYNRCKSESFQLRSLGFVSIDPYGYVQPCSGISIGNAKEKKLSEIIQEYNPETHPIIGPLLKEGPVGLAKKAMSYGFEPTEYVDDCHLCCEARKVLLEYYPEHLAPPIWYRRAK
jgi:MoaA/NifB/PqqE/SkfB family radical SAM enzyme